MCNNNRSDQEHLTHLQNLVTTVNEVIKNCGCDNKIQAEVHIHSCGDLNEEKAREIMGQLFPGQEPRRYDSSEKPQDKTSWLTITVGTHAYTAFFDRP